MTILELRAELLARNTDESVLIAEYLMALPPYFTATTLRRVNAAYARATHLINTIPDSCEAVFTTIS